MDQDATWYGGMPEPRRHCVRWGPSSPQKGAQQPPIFGPCLLWPNAWMDQDAICCGVRPQPWPHCVAWRPSPPKGHGRMAPQFSAHVCCCQTAGWIKMPLGTEVGLGDIVLDGDPAPLKRHSPTFWPMFIVAKWLDGSR